MKDLCCEEKEKMNILMERMRSKMKEREECRSKRYRIIVGEDKRTGGGEILHKGIEKCIKGVRVVKGVSTLNLGMRRKELRVEPRVIFGGMTEERKNKFLLEKVHKILC